MTKKYKEISEKILSVISGTVGICGLCFLFVLGLKFGPLYLIRLFVIFFLVFLLAAISGGILMHIIILPIMIYFKVTDLIQKRKENMNV